MFYFEGFVSLESFFNSSHLFHLCLVNLTSLVFNKSVHFHLFLPVCHVILCAFVLAVSSIFTDFPILFGPTVLFCFLDLACLKDFCLCPLDLLSSHMNKYPYIYQVSVLVKPFLVYWTLRT